MSDPRFPAPIAALVAGYQFERVSIGESAARVFRLTRGGFPPLFLKCASGRARAELSAEAERLRWLAECAPAPRVIALATDRTQACLLLQALPGRNAAEIGAEQAHAVVTGFATALRQLHAQPITGCPFDQGLATQIECARERTHAGLVDEEDFDEERRGRRATELLLQLERERPREEDLVLTHGDACLPNVIFEGECFTGFIDCGRVGVADRYQDLALAARSITGNWGSEWVQHFFEAYGLGDPDPLKLAYYCLLDEFF